MWRLLPFFLLGICCSACGQMMRLITNLPSDLDENSGLITAAQARLWVHNDSGDSAKLYLLDTFGTIVRTLLVDDAQHVDWEDITRDPQGRVYLGDIGNNNNNRQNLVIYRLPNLDTVHGHRVSAEAIRFYYPEQNGFPPVGQERKYDAEALIYYQDSLYIFTKDRTNPHQGYTWLYQIPADTGYHAARLLDSFSTGQNNIVFEVTAASLSPNQQQLVLLGANRVWLFQHFTGADFFGGSLQTLHLSRITQKEAIEFVDDHRVYISNENSFMGRAQLHELLLTNWVTLTTVRPIAAPTVMPNPAQGQVQMHLVLERPLRVAPALYQLDGRCVYRWGAELLPAGHQERHYQLPPLAAGWYYWRVKVGKQWHVKRLRINP